MTVTRDNVRPSGITVDFAIDIYVQLPLTLWRMLILGLADGYCELCKREANLHCHHIDADRKNNCIANGMCLCARCHFEWHFVSQDDKEEAITRMQDERLMYLKRLSRKRR